MDILFRQKISKEIMEFNYPSDQINLTEYFIKQKKIHILLVSDFEVLQNRSYEKPQNRTQ
jgi:hypothetical protein